MEPQPMAPLRTRTGRDLGDKLATMVAEQGWTQGQLVLRTRLSQATVSRLLSGATKDPPIGTVMAVVRALGMTLDQLVGLTPSKEAEPPKTPEDLVKAFPSIERRIAKLERSAFPRRRK